MIRQTAISLQRAAVLATLVLTVPSLSMAQVSVRPQESKPGVEDRLNVRVPTEGGRLAPLTRLDVAAVAATTQSDASDAAAIQTWLKGYDTAFNARDLEQLATFYHPDVTIYEGGGINDGWADYRDRHLGPELKAFENLQFGHREVIVSILPGGQSAYVRSEYFLKAKMGTRDIDSTGLATYVLIKGADGWKIRHSHTSSRPRRPSGG